MKKFHLFLIVSLFFSQLAFSQTPPIVLDATPNPPSDLKIPDFTKNYKGFESTEDKNTETEAVANKPTIPVINTDSKFNIPVASVTDKTVKIKLQQDCYQSFVKTFSEQTDYKIEKFQPYNLISTEETSVNPLKNNVLLRLLRTNIVTNQYTANLNFTVLSKTGKSIDKVYSCSFLKYKDKLIKLEDIEIVN